MPKFQFGELALGFSGHGKFILLIFFLVVDGEYERAAILAEKYHDFHILIQICEQTNNIERLDNYCDKYCDQNFSQYLFNWYIREGKPGRLLEQFRLKTKPEKQKGELLRFLHDHPSLLWLQNIFSQQFKEASDTLQSLAKQEMELVARKKVCKQWSI